MAKRRLLLITGMAGSGKTTVADLLRERNYSVFTMGDVIRHEIRMRNLPPTPENLGKMAEDIRRTGGEDAVAKKCVPLILGDSNPRIALDGIRSMDEVYNFEEPFDTFLIALHASPTTRYNRLKSRGRSDDPPNRQVFRERENRELGFGMAKAIALSDHVITNENGVEDLEKVLDRILSKLRQTDENQD